LQLQTLSQWLQMPQDAAPAVSSTQWSGKLHTVKMQAAAPSLIPPRSLLLMLCTGSDDSRNVASSANDLKQVMNSIGKVVLMACTGSDQLPEPPTQSNTPKVSRSSAVGLPVCLVCG
jgi:hypothetical protein